MTIPSRAFAAREEMTAKQSIKGVVSEELQLPGPYSVSRMIPSELILLNFFPVPLGAFPLHVPSHRLNQCLPERSPQGEMLDASVPTSYTLKINHYQHSEEAPPSVAAAVVTFVSTCIRQSSLKCNIKACDRPIEASTFS